MTHTLTATVDLAALEYNIRYLRNHTKTQLFLLPLKANAYGHGAVCVGEYVERKNLADYLGVAHLGEALTLRDAGITLPLLVMSPSIITEKDLRTAASNDIELTLTSLEQAHMYEMWLAETSHTLKAHISVDTGMGREGILHHAIDHFCTEIVKYPHITIIGLSTHLSRSDEHSLEAHTHTREQLKQFDRCCILVRSIFPHVITHALASGGCIMHGKEHSYNMIRPGLASYGYDPCDTLSLKPVMRIDTPLVAIKSYPADFPIGYGGTYHTTKGEQLGLIPVGYGDGFLRAWASCTPVLHDKKRAVCGRVSMDQTMITSASNDHVGDSVTLIGPGYTACDAARDVGTISYEILTALGNGPRIRHIYKNT